MFSSICGPNICFLNNFLTGSICLWFTNTPHRMPELKAYLSHLDLPIALYNLFSWLEKYFIQCENFPPGKFPNKECVQQLINEFVFNQTESVPKVRLSAFSQI